MQPGRSSVEQLETRQLLTFSATLAGSTATFTVGNTLDSVIFSRDGTGNLQHNTLTAPAGESFADNVDFDSTVALSQHLAAAAGSTVDVQGTAFNATVGTPSAPASTVLANFGLTGNAGSSATIDDSGSSTGNTYTATASSITGTGINVNLTGAAFGVGVGLSTGTGTNIVNVQGDSSPLTVTDSAGTDRVNVGNAGSLAGLTKALTISDPGTGTSVTVDDSADTASTNATLIATGATTASLTNLGTAPINLTTGAGDSLSIKSGTGTDTQTVDFSAGNPIPNGLTYTGGGGGNTLILQGALPGGPFTTEVYNATGPGAGNIALDGSTIDFSGLKPVIDTTPATNFTFNYTGGLDARISVAAGATVNGQATTLISSFAPPGQFEQESYANKTNVTINAGTGNNVVQVTGSALAPGSNTVIDGQGGTNTLNYDAGGSTVVIAPTGTPGQETITRAGSGALTVENFASINIVNGQVQGVPVVPPNLSPAPQIKGFVGAPLTNVVVATFTSSDPTATASSFGATISWGDGTVTAGTVLADASNPTRFYVEGSHTFASIGPAIGFTIGTTVSEKEVNTSILPGPPAIPITQISTALTTGSALIAGLANTSPAPAVTGATEGASFTGTIATFTDSNTAAPASEFNATIAWGDGVVTTGTVTADLTTPGQFLVGGTHTYATSGSKSAVVTIQDTLAPVGTPLTVARTVTVAAATLTPSTTLTITPTVNTPFNGLVATFTSANPLASAADFTATVNWGDGLAPSAGVITLGSSGTFDVTGLHTYLKFPTPPAVRFPVSVTISEVSGATSATATSLALVYDAPLTAQGATLSAVAGQTDTQALVASFTYAGGAVPLSNFSGTISWGDGIMLPFTGASVTSVGTSASGTSYVVHATHTYGTFGTFPVSVTIMSDGGSAAVAQGSAVVTDSPIVPTAQGGPITFIEGLPAPNVTIAAFTDSNDLSPSDFLATIDWGDGHVTPGTVTTGGLPGSYAVFGTNTYEKAGTYSATISIRDTGSTGGSTATIATQVLVTGAVLTQSFAASTASTATVLQPLTADAGSFVSANPFATASDFVASINWGDGSPPTPGIISQGGDLQGGNPLFIVTGTHTYTIPASYSISATVKELASTSTTTLTGSQAVALDAPLTTQGATITAVEGSPLSGALVASFTYAGGQVPTSNFSGTVNWGDGTTSTLTASNFTLVPDGTNVNTYLVNADHTFPSQGTFPVTVTVNSVFGSSAVAHATAIVSDALTVTVLPLAPIEGVAFSNAIVATFKDAGTPDPVSAYSATINWGDGSAVVPGTVVANSNGTFNVISSHKYAAPGNFPVSVTVTDDLSGETTGTANISVTPAALNLLGFLNKASDTGVSDTDAITNDKTPNFFGSAAPGTIIHLYAIPVGTNIPVPIGQTVADASGAWSITSITLADGRYNIEAIGTDQAGVTSALDVLLPNPLQGPLVVDTVAPKVEDVLFQPLSGQVQVTFQDNSSGLDQARVINGANYTFTRVAALPGQAHLKGVALPPASGYLFTGLSTSPQTVPTAPQTVDVSIGDNQPLRGGYYRFTIKSGGIEDVAGNALDGEFYGYFPSGNNLPGGDFVANLDSVHNTVLPPLPVGSTASPLNPPGTLPTATFIPTVTIRATSAKSGKFSLAVNNNLTLVPVAGQSFPGKLELQETKSTLIVGKSTPHVKAAAKPHVAAKKATKPHG